MKRSKSSDSVDSGSAIVVTDSNLKFLFIALCRQSLPRKTLPIKLGSTGYLTIDKDVLSQGNGWCEDDYGRIAIILNNTFLFQRYNNNDTLVKAKDGHTFTAATCSEIRELLKLLQ